MAYISGKIAIFFMVFIVKFLEQRVAPCIYAPVSQYLCLCVYMYTWHTIEMESWFDLINDYVAANAYTDERKGHLPGNNYEQHTGREHRLSS